MQNVGWTPNEEDVALSEVRVPKKDVTSNNVDVKNCKFFITNSIINIKNTFITLLKYIKIIQSCVLTTWNKHRWPPSRKVQLRRSQRSLCGFHLVGCRSVDVHRTDNARSRGSNLGSWGHFKVSLWDLHSYFSANERLFRFGHGFCFKRISKTALTDSSSVMLLYLSPWWSCEPNTSGSRTAGELCWTSSFILQTNDCK